MLGRGPHQQHAAKMISEESIVAYPAALLEDGKWFAALRFEVEGKPFGEDFILRAVPCGTADEAVALAETHLDLAVALAPKIDTALDL